MKFSAGIALLLASVTPALTSVTNGVAILSDTDLQPGFRIDLSGRWGYKPGYEYPKADSPESLLAQDGFVPVTVPQFLNRVRWWLDDSRDFNLSEDERLKKLGFDTERAEDGWYRLQLACPALPSGRHVFLEFDGVAMKCKAYCNGDFLGDHAGMFSRFSFDLTDHLHRGRNQLDIYVSMEKIPASTMSMGKAVTVNLTASKVKSMSKGMYGPFWADANNHSYDLHGIWQPVRLVVRGNAQIDDVWFNPSLTGGVLQVSAHPLATAPAKIVATWTDDKTGRLLAKTHASMRHTNEMLQVRHLKPKLWTPADPNLYRLQVSVLDNDGTVLDQWNGKVGFRTFEIRGNKFFLNGHPWWLRGADHLPYGKNPWDPDLPRKLIQILHDGNIRITRTHCTPWNEAWLEDADEIGLGVSIEGIRPWGLSGKIGPTPPDIFQQWLAENQDVIKRCRNHPSVLIYTVGNEMMLKDSKNLDKWRQLSEVVKQTRQIDPTRPVIASSEYQRDPEFYDSVLKPNGIDDGDIDDLHRYNNWYNSSSFVVDSRFASEMRRNQGRRPLMGQEMSTGYPDLDTGLPVARYTRDLLTPQAWVGNASYPGSDPAIFLEHHRAVTKRWAEQLRFQRDDNTAGFMMFAAECWFSHSYDAKTLRPYPVYEAMKEADAPVGLAWETGRRRFFAGEKIDTAVFISNDDDRFRDFKDLQLEIAFADGEASVLASVATLPYAKTIRVPVSLVLPSINGAREKIAIALRLKQGAGLVSETTDPVEIFRDIPPVSTDAAMIVSLDDLTPGKPGRQRIETGATAILFSPGPGIAKLFPEAVIDSEKAVGEYADFAPIAGTPLARDLEPMDLKWWGRPDDWRTFVASQSERLRDNGPARPLVRFIPPHGYIAEDALPEQKRTVLWELRLGRGRLWVCDLDVEPCAAVDPAARLFERNLFKAAADPASTSALPRVPSHEEFLQKTPAP